MANQIHQLEASVKGTSARYDFTFNEEKGAIEVPGPFTRWGTATVSLFLVGTVCLVAAAPMAIFGSPTVATTLAVLGVTALALFGWARRRPDFEFRVAERAIVFGKTRIPFHAIRPEHLAWHTTSDEIRITLDAHGLRKRLATFRTREEQQARQFHHRLWQLVSATDIRSLGTYGSELSPVQWWISGTSAVFADAQGYPVNELGAYRGPAAVRARQIAKQALTTGWSTETPEQLLGNIDALVARGHREDFARSARLGAMPPDARAEYARLLGEAEKLVVDGASVAAPPLKEVIRRLVFLRSGPEGAHSVLLFDALTTGGARLNGDHDEAALGEIQSFVTLLTTDRDFWKEETYRMETLAGSQPQRTQSQYMIWDYARAMMLYRWGYVLGWLSEQYCWDRMLPLARDVQRHYRSWPEMGDRYLEGRQLWAGGRAPDHETFVESARKMRTDVRSPWNIVDWNLPLHRDWH